MHKLFGLLLGLSLFYTAHTQQVSKEFSRLLVDDNFNKLAGSWNQESNADNLFIGTERGFQVWRKNPKSGFFVLPEKAETFSVFETMVQFSFDPGAKSQSAGLVLQAQADGSGAIIVEINKKKQYRIRRAVNNRIVPITGDGDGWIKAKKAITTGDNQILIRTYDKIYDLFINGIFIRSFTEIEYSEGKIGLYIGSASKVVFKQLVVKTDDDHANDKGNQSGPVDEEKTLSQIIVKLRETINKKDKRISELEYDLRLAASRGNQDTLLLKQKKEAETRWQQCTREIEIVKSDKEILQSRLAYLEEFKKQIQESENGDIIINLSKLSATQKDQIDLLQSTIKSQSLTIERLKREKAEVEKQLEQEKAAADQLRNNQIGLLQRIIEKDSMIAALEERIVAMDAALAACSTKTKKEDKSPAVKGKKRKKSQRKNESILFDE